MNVIKGLDRIFIIIAVVAVVPGFFIGTNSFYELFKSETPEHIEWRREYDDQRSYMWQKRLKDSEPLGPLNPSPAEDELVMRIIKSNEPRAFNHPPDWLNIIGGFVGSVSSFFIVLFGFKGLAHGIKRLSTWIIEGFKN